MCVLLITFHPDVPDPPVLFPDVPNVLPGNQTLFFRHSVLIHIGLVCFRVLLIFQFFPVSAKQMSACRDQRQKQDTGCRDQCTRISPSACIPSSRYDFRHSARCQQRNPESFRLLFLSVYQNLPSGIKRNGRKQPALLAAGNASFKEVSVQLVKFHGCAESFAATEPRPFSEKR